MNRGGVWGDVNHVVRWLLTISALFAYNNSVVWKGMLAKEKNSRAKRSVEVLQGAQTRQTKIKLLFCRHAFSVPLLTVCLFQESISLKDQQTNTASFQQYIVLLRQKATSQCEAIQASYKQGFNSLLWVLQVFRAKREPHCWTLHDLLTLLLLRGPLKSPVVTHNRQQGGRAHNKAAQVVLERYYCLHCPLFHIVLSQTLNLLI